MPGMTPSAATDSLMWTWMTHFKLHLYCIKRWRQQGDLTNHIRNHWFVGNEADALWQNNTASRTWWIAQYGYQGCESIRWSIYRRRSNRNHFSRTIQGITITCWTGTSASIRCRVR